MLRTWLRDWLFRERTGTIRRKQTGRPVRNSRLELLEPRYALTGSPIAVVNGRSEI